MLYIDQPVQSGFSYDTLMNGTVNLVTGETLPIQKSSPNSSVWAGILPSQNLNSTTITTAMSARALWHFMQTFITEYVGIAPHQRQGLIVT